MANLILGTRSPNGNVGVSGVVDSGELSMLSAGALSGFALAALTGMQVGAGGVAGTQDAAVAKNPADASDLLVGNGAQMVFILGAAPGTSGQSRTDALVVWKDTTVLSTQNNGYDAVGYQVVPGAAATTGAQQPPSDATIRAALPNGGSAFYAIVGYATVPYGATAATAVLLTSYAVLKASVARVPRTQSAFAEFNPLSNGTVGVTYYSRLASGQAAAGPLFSISDDGTKALLTVNKKCTLLFAARVVVNAGAGPGRGALTAQYTPNGGAGYPIDAQFLYLPAVATSNVTAGNNFSVVANAGDTLSTNFYFNAGTAGACALLGYPNKYHTWQVVAIEDMS